ncbi:hypothetical protein GLOIN_2v1844288 [Rhizophagus clarus]|uniref:Uncharacterized protein n=1 Tax=Rhizophagus clarus TaxID=94130 RepID=A0A8H3LQY3_9GLOM|nr:hypothetical protein GLOIN_2v1844288 [Rhizophagus clarus]
MNHKKSLENSAYEESDNDFSNYSTDIETFTEKNSTKKNTMDKIIELKKQLKYLKEKASKDNDEQESIEWSSSDPEQPIPKYKGYNYYDIPRLLHIKKRTWNGYMEAMRHICKEYLSEVANITMYKDIDAGLLNKVVDKFNKKNDQFPKTIGDWAQREIIQRYVNNFRESKRNPTHNKKKQSVLKSRKINKKSNDIDLNITDSEHNIPNSLADNNFTPDFPKDITPDSPEYIASNFQELIITDSQKYTNYELQSNSDTCLMKRLVNKKQKKVLGNSNINQTQNLKLNDPYSTNKFTNKKQVNDSNKNTNLEQAVQDNSSKQPITVHRSTKKRTKCQ